MEEAPPLREQFEEIWNFVHDLCENESKLVLTHAFDEDAPACEMVTTKAKFEAWEDPAATEPSDLMPFGIAEPGRPWYNYCPICKGFCAVNPATPVGLVIECLLCHLHFRRNL